ncbi:Zinc finger protein BRUTUS [Balamuthia mandrillaris]
MVKAACCGRWYTCRVCHDEDEEIDHAMDRTATKEMKCMHCQTEQAVAANCSHCGRCLGQYYCPHCKLWDNDTTKDIYHCPHCRICRLGKGLGIDYFHCQRCNACLAIALKERHKCVSDALNNNCPVCWEQLFSSREALAVLPCGHIMHRSCLEAYTSKAYSKCPTCFTSLLPDEDGEDENGNDARRRFNNWWRRVARRMIDGRPQQQRRENVGFVQMGRALIFVLFLVQLFMWYAYGGCTKPT